MHNNTTMIVGCAWGSKIRNNDITVNYNLQYIIASCWFCIFIINYFPHQYYCLNFDWKKLRISRRTTDLQYTELQFSKGIYNCVKFIFFRT